MWTWSSSLLSCPGVLASWLCGLRSSFVDETKIPMLGLTQETCAFLLQFRTDVFFLLRLNPGSIFCQRLVFTRCFFILAYLCTRIEILAMSSFCEFQQLPSSVDLSNVQPFWGKERFLLNFLQCRNFICNCKYLHCNIVRKK